MKVWRQISVNFINLCSNKYTSNIWGSPKLVFLIPLNCEFIQFLLDHNRSQKAVSITCLLWRRPWNPINSCTYKTAQNLLTGQRTGETEPPDRTSCQNLTTEPHDRTSWQNLLTEPYDRNSWQNLLTEPAVVARLQFGRLGTFVAYWTREWS